MKKFVSDWKNIVIAILCIVTVGLAGGIGYYIYKVNSFGVNRHVGGYVSVLQDASESEPEYTQNIVERYQFPSLERMAETERGSLVESLQVVQKISLLGLDVETFKNPENTLNDLEKYMEDVNAGIMNTQREQVEFNGTSGGKLEGFMKENQGKDILITSDVIEVLGSISVPEDTHLYANGAKFVGNGDILFKLEAVNNVVLDGFVLDGGYRDAVYAVESSNVIIQNATVKNLDSKALVFVGGCQNLFIEHNELIGNLEGGIHITGFAKEIRIQDNTVAECHGTRNYAAGIVFSGLMPPDVWNVWTASKSTLLEESYAPHNVIVKNNVVRNNYANGIYSDGAFLCYYVSNQVIDNDKEGICLDCGSLGNFLTENSFLRNGRRYYQTDADLAADFVLAIGRMEDGSSKSKTPGVSMDNAAYNVIKNNLVADNYGGGIKAVRSSVCNIIMENVINDNNIGENDVFHFFGIELGTAIPDDGDLQGAAIDYAPCFENIIARNTITGDHYSGVFISTDGYCNDVFDNIIMDCGWFSIEAISAKFNSIVNNTSNVDMRNEYQP